MSPTTVADASAGERAAPASPPRRKRPPEELAAAEGMTSAQDMHATTAAKNATDGGGDLDAKIAAFLHSRTLAANPSKIQKEAHRPCTKCRAAKIRERYDASEWSRPNRRCKACLAKAGRKRQRAEGEKDAEGAEERLQLHRKREARKERLAQKQAKKQPKTVGPGPSSFTFGTVADSEEEAEDLPELDELTLPGGRKNGETPSGRIRSCMCREPGRCRDLTWRWARLGEATYVNYVHLPHAHVERTAVGAHVRAYREGAMRHLGYGEGEATRKLKKVPKSKKKGAAADEMGDGEGLATKPKREKKDIAMVHFHPEVIPYLLDEKDSDMSKTNKWRVPLEVGRKIGLTKEDKCPTRDQADRQTYFALPSYSMDDAAADVERAEMEYRRQRKRLEETTEEDLVAHPSRYVREIHDLERRNAKLAQENEQLQMRIAREAAKQRNAEVTHQKLNKGVEKMTRRVLKWESAKGGVGRPAKRDCHELYMEATGEEFVPNAALFYGAEPPALRRGGKRAQGGRRWSDRRMDKAVEEKWRDPSMKLEEALKRGGFEYAPPEEGQKSGEVKDADGVTLAQRKNNLSRRLRVRKQAAVTKTGRKKGRAKRGRKAKGGGDTFSPASLRIQRDAEENEMHEDTDEQQEANVGMMV